MSAAGVMASRPPKNARVAQTCAAVSSGWRVAGPTQALGTRTMP